MGPLTEEVFIQRTFEIIEQYRAAKGQSPKEYYDVTLLFNCLLGLVVMPKNHLNGKKFGSSDDRALSPAIKETVSSAKDKNGKPIDIQFIEYIIGLRNGISHLCLGEKTVFGEESNGVISTVEITGKTNNYNHTIGYKFNMEEDQLEKVVSEIIDFIYPGKFVSQLSV